VVSFGNGAACTFPSASGEGNGLDVCGPSATRMCSRGGLCFDASAFDCGCQADADCASRAAYINAARVSISKAPLVARCDGGRCSGDL
jgi:hypothetical protein